MTIENLKQIAIKYATTKGSRVPLAPDELCNAVVQYFNEFLKITADINTLQVAVTEEGGNIVFTITGNTLDGKAFTPIVITVDRNDFVTNQEFEEFKTSVTKQLNNKRSVISSPASSYVVYTQANGLESNLPYSELANQTSTNIMARRANGTSDVKKGISGENVANMQNIADVEEKISKCPTLDGNNDFTGENTFEEAIQAKKGTVVKNSLDETNYNAGYISRNDWTYLFPADSGTFALTKNIPTDYATQTALANTQRQVDGLYTLLEQKGEIYVQTATDTYTTRETAGGENIADGVQTPVKKITGKTVKTTNLIPYPYGQSERHENGIDFVVNSDGTITVNGTATGTAQFYPLYRTPLSDIGLSVGQQYTLGALPSSSYSSDEVRIVIQFYNTSGGVVSSFVASANTSQTFNVPEGAVSCMIYFVAITGVTLSNYTFSPMLNEGSTALPYKPYFPGLKNAFFKEIVSTGKNLIDLSGVSLEKTVNGVTFTKISDGLYRVTGTIADPSQGTISTVNINQGKVYPAGVYSIARYTVDGKDIEFFVSAYSAKTGASIRNIDMANININEDFVIRFAGIYVNEAITGAIDLTVSTMLNYGSSALPYEPYTQSVLSLPEAVELTEYDTAYPETGEIQRQSNTVTFNGTETWNDLSDDTRYIYGINIPTPAVLAPYKGVICNLFPSSEVNGVYLTGIVDGTCQSLAAQFLKSSFPQFDSVTAWKAYLAAQSAAGNPLTVTYKTAEVQSTEQADFSADSYIAWKNGSETIEQGNTDNSIYGAENTVEQDYYLLTAPRR